MLQDVAYGVYVFLEAHREQNWSANLSLILRQGDSYLSWTERVSQICRLVENLVVGTFVGVSHDR
jgi:hypothetical protein